MDDRSKWLESTLSRREFAALSVGAGLAGVAVPAAAAAEVVEVDVQVRTADGVCDAAFYHPTGAGPWPGVLIWPDAMGLRPAFRDMGQRLAAEGYAVLVPNPYYRRAKAPVLDHPIDFSNPADRALIDELMGSLSQDTALRDAAAFVAFIDAQPQTNAKVKMGVQGYCMGGPLVVRTAASQAQRIGAGGSFHGGGLVTQAPDSPHLLVDRIKGEMYFAVASNDDMRDPDAKTKLKEALGAAHVKGRVEVYDGAQHGWCVKDMANIYDETSAERAWGELLALYKRNLV